MAEKIAGIIFLLLLMYSSCSACDAFAGAFRSIPGNAAPN